MAPGNGDNAWARTAGTDVAKVAVVTLASIAAMAAPIALVGAPTVRELVNAPFAGVSPTFASVFDIFGGNVRLLIGALVACALMRAPRSVVGRSSRPGFLLCRAGQGVGHLYMGLLFAVNVVSIGALLGAYGSQMAWALLPHGPFELAAFSLVGALYLDAAGSAPIESRSTTRTVGWAVLALAVGAVLETVAI